MVMRRRKSLQTNQGREGQFVGVFHLSDLPSSSVERGKNSRNHVGSFPHLSLLLKTLLGKERKGGWKLEARVKVGGIEPSKLNSLPPSLHVIRRRPAQYKYT